MDQERSGPDDDRSMAPIGRVNIRPNGEADDPERWSLRAMLLGILALAVMVITLLIVLQWALDAPTF